MFSFLKRKPAAPQSSFKARVEQFWEWYAQVASRFYQTIESGKCPELAPEVIEAVKALGPGFAWVFGPGPNGQGHSFTLSGEGNLHRQLLTQYWATCAPALAGWTFYDSRQPGSIKGQRLNMGGQKFDPIEFWLVPAVDRERKKLDLTVWHPLFHVLPEKERWTVLFIFLDQVLGEYGTEQWVGEIQHDSQRMAEAISLEELPDFIARTKAEEGWEKLPPGQSATGYQSKAQDGRYPRGDVITGTTMNMALIRQYLEAEGALEDPLAGTGADYVYVAFDAAILPQGKQVVVRGKIEDALDAALRSAASGRLLGGALGSQFAYIDLLLLDGDSSIEIVEGVLRQENLPAGTTIDFFAREKRSQRRRL